MDKCVMTCGSCPPQDMTMSSAQARRPGGCLMYTANASMNITDPNSLAKRTGSPGCARVRRRGVGSSTLRHTGRRRRIRNTGVPIPAT
jgi:hypothetical protein